MALFKKTTKKEVAAPKAEAKAVTVKEKKAPSVSSPMPLSSHVLLSPRITEKAAIANDAGVYVFNITKSATKPQVAKAVTELFKVIPRKVSIVNVKPTRVMTRNTGKKGFTNGAKKAYVYLKKGEKIELA